MLALSIAATWCDDDSTRCIDERRIVRRVHIATRFIYESDIQMKESTPCYLKNCAYKVAPYADFCGAGHKQPTEDKRVFGDCWVYCNQHMKPHETGWCTISVRDKVKLDATNAKDAYAECEAKGLKLYGHD